MEKSYFTTKQLSQYIGRSEQAISDLVCRKAIPYRKSAGRLLFRKAEVDRWIDVSGGLSLNSWEGTRRQSDSTKFL
jgi:excisionase family DNA binding protein